NQMLPISDHMTCLFIFKKMTNLRGVGYVKQMINLGRPNGYRIQNEQETVLKLRWYNYAESFQMRIMEEMERDLSISEQTARTKMYREIQEIKKLSKEEYTRLRKMTSKAERFYRMIEKAGGKDKIKCLSGISVDAITKLRKRELENLYRGLNTKEDTGEEGRICEIINEQSDT